MSESSHRRKPDAAMNALPQQPHPSQGPDQGSAALASEPPTRLQVIHDLVRSGGYHVPATEIADRMIERLIGTKRDRST